MILCKFRETHEDKVEFDNVGLRGWRWIVEVVAFSISLQRQVIFHKSEKPEWQSCSNYFNVSLTKYFILGPEHTYYDGPHCSFSIGWIHFNWSYWWCTKCMPD